MASSSEPLLAAAKADSPARDGPLSRERYSVEEVTSAGTEQLLQPRNCWEKGCPK